MSEGNRAEELAAQAAEAVRRTVGEAEAKAKQIVNDAEAEAKRIRDEAETEAGQVRARSEADARERIERARQALLAEDEPSRAPALEPSPGAEPVAATEAPISPPTETQPTSGGANGDDAAARLVAMKLAVDGKGREEIEAELTQRFGPGDRSGLLDDVLSRAGR